MFIKSKQLKLFLLFIFTLLLCHCTKATRPILPQPLKSAKQKVKTPYQLPTASYLALAEQEQGGAQQKMLLLASGSMIAGGQLQQAASILNRTQFLTETEQVEKKLLLAKIQAMRANPQSALNQLSQITQIEQLSLYFQIFYHRLLAESYQAKGHYLESVVERMKLASLLESDASQRANARALWLALMAIPQAELELKAQETKHSQLQGWLELALIAGKQAAQPSTLAASLELWRARFNTHPATALLREHLTEVLKQSKPHKIALLLPLSGPLAGPGQAIREGFMASYTENQAQHPFQLAEYDTAKDSVTRLYEQALKEGADTIVGPLTKDQVRTIAAIEHPVPTLLLNDSEVSPQDNAYSFSLSPQNEAVQVAKKARSKGYTRALVIVPENNWGHEVNAAFINQWQKQGGQIVDTLSYAAGDDLNKKMRDFLQISDSQARGKELKQLLGQDLETIASRRQDYEFIFLLAYPSKARQIIPLLRYYYAENSPVYATSSVYSGNALALKDKDLDGVIFCDIPWVFAHQLGSKNWPEQFNSYNRLYALGQDSYTLAMGLDQLKLFPAEQSRPTNSILYLKSKKQIAQVLEWGQFKQGLVHSLGNA